MKQRCAYEDEDGVGTFFQVFVASDCPYFNKAKINLVTDRYPQRLVKDADDDEVAIVDTLSDNISDIDSFRDVPQYRRRRRF